MRVDETREAYQALTGKAGDIARQLAFAGIAIIWIFTKTSAGGEIEPPRDMIIAGLALLIGLALDLLQYVISAAIWGFYGNKKELEFGPRSEHPGSAASPEFAANRYLNWPANVLLWSKLLAVCAAYIVLGLALVDRVSL